MGDLLCVLTILDSFGVKASPVVGFREHLLDDIVLPPDNDKAIQQ